MWARLHAIAVVATLLPPPFCARALSLNGISGNATGHGSIAKAQRQVMAAVAGADTPDGIIAEYFALHGPKAFRREFEANKSMICDRKYLSQGCTAPPRFGNKMGEFLNGFALAIVTNRTFLLTSDTCSHYLDFSGRLLQMHDVKGMMKEAGCDLGWRSLSYQNGKQLHGAIDRDFHFHVTSRLWHREVAAKVVNNPDLGEAAARRARGLFGSSALSGYHALFSAAWTFKESVRAPVEELLRARAGDFKVGLHVRHAVGCMGYCPVFDEKAVKCVKAVLNRSASPGGCTVLLATDNPDSQAEIPEQLRKESARIASDASTVARFAKQIEAATGCKAASTLQTERVEERDYEGEHGLWNRDTAMMDMYMLSRSDTLVIGEGQSSFSERAAELFLDREAKKHDIYDWEYEC